LVELDIPRMLDTSGNVALKMLRQSFYVSEPKDSGVEPGYLGYQTEDAVSLFYEEYPDPIQRLDKIRSFNGKFSTLIKAYEAELDRHVVKLTYNNITEAGIVIPDTDDLARASTIKRIYDRFGWFGQTLALQIYQNARKRHLKDVNRDAVAEVLANDVARAFGMEVQDQRLIKDRHSDGRLKLPLKAKWVEGASLMNPLAGSGVSEKYYVRPVILASDDIEYLSTNHIRQLPQYFALLAVIGDRDKIGSHGQNMLVKKRELVGIDFGHAYDGMNPLINTLNFDFTFFAPTFKNYSVFLDADRSELMEGILKVARWNGEHIAPEVVASYGPDFDMVYRRIKTFADEQVFDDYIKKFTALREDNPRNASEYKVIIDDIRTKKAMHIASREQILRKFRPYIGLPAPLINTMQNFERLWAATQGNTSMRSPDGKVMLRHIRVTKNQVLEWKTAASNANTIALEAIFASKQDVLDAIEDLQTHQIKVPGFQLVPEGNRLLMTLPRSQLHAITELMREDNIKYNYHTKDFLKSEVLLSEERFSQTVDVMKQYHLELNVRAVKDQAIELTVTPEPSPTPTADNPNPRSRSQEVANFILKGLTCCDVDVAVDMNGLTKAMIPPEKLDRVTDFLKVFDACYQHYEKTRNQLQKLSNEILKKEGIGVHFILNLIYDNGQFKFHLKVRSPDEDVEIDLMTEGDILQTIVQLETLKSRVLEGYQQYRCQKYKLLLEQQVVSLSAFLREHYTAPSENQQLFTKRDPAIQLADYLSSWSDLKSGYSPVALKELGEKIAIRIRHVNHVKKERLRMSVLGGERPSEIKRFYVEIERLEKIAESIRQLQLLPGARAQADRERNEALSDSAMSDSASDSSDDEMSFRV
ncbi:MAG: hypothetical protein KDH94_03310, partial [Coxiellaceae bacterium]|nr:hypothetical protein [Coxiellaceae bacterium]